MKENSDFTILIVDDEIINIKIASVYLKREGYKVLYTTEPLNAMKYVEQHNINLILLDIDMPLKNGFEVCDSLKKNKKTKDIPIIFLTAQADIEYISRAFKAGGVDYMIKPFNPIELKVRVETHLTIVSYLDEIKEKQNKLAIYSITDPLTKLYNSLYFDSKILNNQKQKQKFWFITFKIDRLDRLNQIYGLFDTDKIIKNFAKLIKSKAKTDFIVARLHGGSVGVLVNTSLKKPILELYQSITLAAHRDELLANRVTFSTIIYFVQKSSISLPHIYKKIHTSMHSLQQSNEHKYSIIE